jgi:hypothetical protein
VNHTARIFSAVTAAALALALAACDTTSSGGDSGDAALNQQQAISDQQYAFIQPLPYFPFSQIRQNVIEAEAIDALGINSTTFFFVPGIDHPVYVCASVGVPVPATDSISNPWVAQWSGYGGSNGNAVAGVPVGQMEPDGVFPGDTTGTNTLCLNGKGREFLGYNEAFDISFTAPAHWDPNALGPGKGQVVVTGDPVLPVCTVRVTDAAKRQAEEVCVDPTHSSSAKPPAGTPTDAPKPTPSSS